MNPLDKLVRPLHESLALALGSLVSKPIARLRDVGARIDGAVVDADDCWPDDEGDE